MAQAEKPPTSDTAVKGRTVVLAFHRVVDVPERDHDIRWGNFLSLMDRLDVGRVGSHLDDPTGMWMGADVVLTFDDATDDHLRVAEELHRRGLPGLFFVPADKLDQPSFLTTKHLLHIHALGHTVGAHGVTHTPLRDLPRERVIQEVADSKTRLEDAVHESVTLFAPPGGVGSPHLVPALLASGYVASRSMRWGVYRSARDRWQIPTVPVTEVTFGRGWVARAIDRRHLPAPMRAAWTTKQLMPARMRTMLRRRIHAAGRPPAQGAST